MQQTNRAPVITNKDFSFVKLQGKFYRENGILVTSCPQSVSSRQNWEWGRQSFIQLFEKLASMGLVDIKPQSGIYVADYMKT